jgi:tetratricopeptide (TPR) repeat protein
MLPRENQLESDKLTEFCSFPAVLLSLFFLAALVLALPLRAQEQPPNWQAQVRKYSEASDWTAALRVIDAEIARAPQDLDLKAWRARVLTWAGRPEEAEHAYREILSVEGPSHNDPDHWAGLATVCLRQGKIEEARGAIETAVKIDPKRADLHVAYANILRAAGEPTKAQAELEKARSLDPTGTKAPQPIKTGRTHLNEFRGGVETDSLSYTVPNQGQSASLATQWTPLWSTNLGGAFYQRSGIFADKFVGSITFRAPSLAAITAGGAIADDNAIIPKSEAFFDFDRGLARREAKFLKGVELEYGQHWYWYQTARILTLNGAAILYFSRDWSLTLGATGARSAFSGTGVEWRPSGITRLGFPLAGWSAARLSGSVLFAAGSENFASADQIGRFASQTYGGGLRFEYSPRFYVAFN